MTIRTKSKNLGIGLALFISAALAPWAAKADWLNLTGAETAPNHPTANRPAQGDFLDVMRATAERMAASLQE